MRQAVKDGNREQAPAILAAIAVTADKAVASSELRPEVTTIRSE